MQRLNQRPVAPYATSAADSRGRLHKEATCPLRTVFQRDRDRIVHSAAFRRLTYKTQVFIYHEGDHFRTRLTHSLEVAQIARTIARALFLDEDLAETIALAHDLGHTPFGHAGEEALTAAMANAGGFDHNAQSLRIVTHLERRYAAFRGLNLTWETLEGLVKHNGPLLGPDSLPAGRYAAGLPHAVVVYARDHDLELATLAGPEAQVAALADDIAYNNHDIDDALRAGLIDATRLADMPLAGPIAAKVAAERGPLPPPQLMHEVNRRMITAMIEDVVAETRLRLVAINPRNVGDIHAAAAPVVAFSPAMAEGVAALRAVLFEAVYFHPRIAGIMADAKTVVADLYRHFLAHPAQMPEDWAGAPMPPEGASLTRRVGDFVAGMTDRLAIETHRRLFDATPRLR